MIEAFDSPATFAELYNEAASRRNKHGGKEYLLSEGLVDYLHLVEKGKVAVVVSSREFRVNLRKYFDYVSVKLDSSEDTEPPTTVPDKQIFH